MPVSSSHNTTQRRRPRSSASSNTATTTSRSSTMSLSATVTLMLTASVAVVTPSVHAFQMTSVNGLSLTEPRAAASTTRRFFRHTADAAPEHMIPTGAAAAQQPIHNPFVNPPSFVTPQLETATTTATSTTSSSTTELPTWLADSKDAWWESHWHTLEEAMLESFFTPQETQRLLQTIEQAAQGDRHQMATAAEFCYILVETMEMGLTALMAAAHHICACVTARHEVAFDTPDTTTTTTTTSPMDSSSSSSSSHQLWDHAFANALRSSIPEQQQQYHHYHTQQQQQPGGSEQDYVALIAKDAGRLKTLEMVAAMIYSDKSKASSRVTPDAQDAQNLRSLLLSETKDWRALAIRSAAALFRLRGILNHAHHYQNDGHVALTPEAMQCSREALHIYAPLASRLGMHRLKNELEGAAFRILYRRQSRKVHSLARELRPRHSRPHLNRGLVEMCDHSLDISSCMKTVLETVQADMTALLQQDAHFAEHVQDFTVTARVKEPYSLWKKMLRNKWRHIMEVPDAIALRVVLDAKRVPGEDDAVLRARERALCYYAQKLCLEQWQPAGEDARFKDYIESPKRNGYQSLHYTAHTMWDSEDFKFEIQVRTGEMHQVAEFGLASHWDYKAQQKMNSADQHEYCYQEEAPSPEATISTTGAYTNDAYTRSVQEWHWQHHAGTTQQNEQQQWMSDSYPSASYDDVVAEPAATEEEWAATPTSIEATERADRIRARTKKLLPYIEALTAAQTDLAREHVFVFLTSEEDDAAVDADGQQNQHGRVLSLPAGACVLDALREGERELGIAFPDHHRLNGEISTKVTSKLQNGDILTIPLRGTPTTMA